MRAIAAVFYREFLIRRTSPMWLFFDMAVPLLYLLMFGVAFDKAFRFGLQISGAAVSYNEYFLAGVLSMASFGSALNQSYGFFIDRDNGIFYEFLTYPMTRSQFLVGKILFQCCMSVIQCLFALFAGTILLNVGVLWGRAPLVLGGMMIGTTGWFFFLAIFAFKIRRNDAFNTVINVAYYLLMFVSSIFYPLDQVPVWLKTVASLNPLTWHTDVLRYLTIGVGEFSAVLIEASCFILFSLLSFWAALRTLQKTV